MWIKEPPGDRYGVWRVTGEIVVPSLTAEEKAKLNEALAYQETMGDVSFPIEVGFRHCRIWFKLQHKCDK